jgi:DNA-binding transcriptional LysR family regulator
MSNKTSPRRQKAVDRLTEMRTFVAVAKFQSFTRAAHNLGVSPSSVSRAIAVLETRSRARLFHRTTRRVCLTESAQVFYECCERILAQMDAAELRLTSGKHQLAGILKLVVHPTVAASELPRILAGYRARAPQVSLVIATSESRTDLVAGGYDVGLLPPHLIGNSTAISRSMKTSERILVASTPYLVSHGRPQVAADLCSHSMMCTRDSVRRAERSLVVRKEDQAEELRIRPSLCAEDSVLQSCAIASMGIALVPADLVNDALLAGALEHVLPDYTLVGAEMELCLVYPSREFVPANSRAFIDYCIELFGHTSTLAERRDDCGSGSYASVGALDN